MEYFGEVFFNFLIDLPLIWIIVISIGIQLGTKPSIQQKKNIF